MNSPATFEQKIGFDRLREQVAARCTMRAARERIAAEDFSTSPREIERRQVGSLVAFETGEAVAYGLAAAQERGALFIGPGTMVYEGMIVGENPRGEDMAVNVCKKKQLTNMRASGSDDALRLIPPRQMSIEAALEFISDDELLEITPESIRMRKRVLSNTERLKKTKGGKK